MDRAGGRRKRTVCLPVLDADEQTVFGCIQDYPKHIDRIMKESGLAAGRLSAILVMLELKGVVSQVPGKHYVRSDELEA